MMSRIEKVSSNSFYISVSNTDGELIHSNGNPAPGIVQSILNRYNIQIPDQMEASILVVLDLEAGGEIQPERGEIIEMHETESGITPISTGAMLTGGELYDLAAEYEEDIRMSFETELGGSYENGY